MAIVADCPPAIVEIHDRRGGYLWPVWRRVEQYRRCGTVVRVTGAAWSAWSLVITLPTVCAGRRASFVFHQARHGHFGPPDVEATAAMFAQYGKRGGLQDWILRHGGLGPHPLRLEGKALGRLVPPCGKVNQ